MRDLCDSLGTSVRRLREARQWSQEILAEKAGLNRSYVGEVERGKAVPSLLTLEKLAVALDLNTSDLLAHCERIHRPKIDNLLDWRL
jgi:transcriptional regulator with XRE-family HTH domain